MSEELIKRLREHSNKATTSDYVCALMREAADAIAKLEAPAVQVPDGMVLVLARPTDEMVNRGMDAALQCEYADGWDELSGCEQAAAETRAAYLAMLASAPALCPRPAPAPATCNYPDCKCPFDAPADPDWCARGLPKKAPATVATETVAQAGGVDVEKVMALVQEFGEQCEATGYLDRSGSQDASKKLHDTAYQTAVKIRALLSASPAGVGGWIPVGERLPEAGKGVLAYYKNSHGYGRIVRAFYAPKHALEANSYDDDGQFDYDEATDTAYLPEGWLEKIDNWGDFSSIYIVEGEVTHWQPLPAAPAATKKEKEE